MSLSQDHRFFDICHRFESEWKAHLHNDLLPYLDQVPELERPLLFQELLHSDFEIRKKHGLPCSQAWYRQAYPQYVKAIDAVFPQLQPPDLTATVTNEETGPAQQSIVSAVPGALVGEYEILEIVGEGGMGTVCKARSTLTEQMVALKQIKAGSLITEEDRQRFLHEAKIASTFEHPHIVQVHHVGLQNQQPYFIMKLLEEGDLKGHLKQFSPEQRQSKSYQRESALLLRKIAEAVDYAHQRAIIHRDLKPGNILIDAQGQPQITDFGLAVPIQERSNESQRDRFAMTLPYASPEQINGSTLTFGTDVYGLGVILYEALTGERPFQAESVNALKRQIQEDSPPSLGNRNPQVDHRLECICLKCLKKDPKDRYQSAKDLAQDLGNFLEERTSSNWPLTFRDLIHSVLKSSFTFEPWSTKWLFLFCWGLFIVLTYVFQYFAIAARWSEPVIWLSCFIQYPMFGLLIFHRRAQASGPPERLLRAIWLGLLCSKLTILATGRILFPNAYFGEIVLFTFPAWATVNGMTSLACAVMYWSRDYIYGSGLFILAFLMLLYLPIAPLIFGAHQAIRNFDFTWHLYRLDCSRKATIEDSAR